MLPTLPDKPEPTAEAREAARKADRITYSELLAEMGWTPDEFNRAKSYGFPGSLGVIDKGWGRGRQAYYSRTKVAEWIEPLVAWHGALVAFNEKLK